MCLKDFPYEGYTYATISVRYMKKYGYDVTIVISKGQIHGNQYNRKFYPKLYYQSPCFC